jgi:hypothetical protein
MADNVPDAGSSPENPQVAGPVSTEAAGADAYQGKSTDQVIAMHRELESKLSEQGNELGEFREFFRRVGPYFKREGEEVILNEDMIRRVADAQGWLSSKETPNPAVSGSQTPASNGEGAVFEKEETASIRDMIKSEIRDAFKTSVEPLQQQFHQSQHSQWMDSVRSKYPDFDSFRPKIAEYMNKTGYQVNDVGSLEDAYRTVKMLAGGMVDRKETEAHVAELQKTLQTLRPGVGGGPSKPQTELTNAELMGLETADTPEKQAFETLTGKPFYRP